MTAAVAILPTDAAIEAAWERYRVIANLIVDDPKLLLDRAYAERNALAWAEWRDLFLARTKRC